MINSLIQPLMYNKGVYNIYSKIQHSVTSLNIQQTGNPDMNERPALWWQMFISLIYLFIYLLPIDCDIVKLASGLYCVFS